MKDVIRWGIIGCGDVVETKNGPAFYLAEGSELAGIWNRTKSKAVDWCTRHGHGRAYDTLEELLSDPDIDIIYIATPPNVHKQYAIQVAQAHKHCYLEKPLALSWEEAEEIHAAFKESKTRCFTAHYRRGMPRYRELKKLLDEGTLGNNSRSSGNSHPASNSRRNASRRPKALACSPRDFGWQPFL